MEKKMTKKEMFAMAIAMVQGIEGNENQEKVVKFLEREVELLENRNTRKKETPTQKENAELKGVIVELLKTSETGMTISEMIVGAERLKGLSNQKVTALVSQLVEVKTIEKRMEKRRSVFSLVV